MKLHSAGFLDSNDTAKSLMMDTWTHGYFNFCVPLHVIGLCEDYKRVIINARHELILIRARNDNNYIVGDLRDFTLVIINFSRQNESVKSGTYVSCGCTIRI